MRRELWGSVDNTRAIEDIREAVMDSNVFKQAGSKVESIKAKLDVLKVKEAKLREAYNKLTDMRHEFEGYLPSRCGGDEFSAPVCNA